jgi:DNA primase
MDVVACHQAGVATAVAPLGTAFTPQQARTVSRYARRGILVFDPDEAGQAAAFRAAPILAQFSLEGFTVTLPSDQDPADILSQQGPQAVVDALNEEEDILTFLISSAKKRAESPDLVLKELFPYINSISSEVSREHHLERVADVLGVDKFAVRADYERGGASSSEGQITKADTRKLETIDFFLMLATYANREHFSFVRNTLRLEDLQDEHARSLFVALEESYRRSIDSTESVLSRIDDDSLRNEVRRRIASEEFYQNAEQLIHDAVYRIKERSITHRQGRIDTRLRRLRSSDSDTRAEERELLEEKMFLNGELQKLKRVR